MTSLLNPGEIQLSDENGAPYAGGTLAFYIPGTLTFRDTWADRLQVTLNSNPVVLDSAGRASIWGTGVYRTILKDAAGNQIWDKETSAPLADDAISAVMLSVVGASTLAGARSLMGIDAAIASAVSTIELLPGPTGPTGPQGVQGNASTVPGPTGPQGPAAGGGGFNGAVQCGVVTSGMDGIITIVFPTQFSNNPVYIGLTWDEGPGGPAPAGATGFFYPTVLRANTIISADRNGFSTLLTDADGNPLPVSGCQWFAIGF